VRTMESANDLIENTPGSELGHKVVRPVWQELHGELMARLDKLTVDDLCNRANDSGIKSDGRQNLDFAI
jgi:Rrf2 family transcriptional regulator, iron-sulfur cluster assembly transcription factor